LSRPDRQRAIGGGTPFTLTPREQFLLTIIWLRLYPMHTVLGFLCGVTHSTVGRVLARVLPLPERRQHRAGRWCACHRAE
jgi:hypothetical protein